MSKPKAQCDHLAPHMQPCATHDNDPWTCPDILFCVTDRGYGIPIRDGGSSYVPIRFCPFCGDKLKLPKGEGRP